MKKRLILFLLIITGCASTSAPQVVQVMGPGNCLTLQEESGRLVIACPRRLPLKLMRLFDARGYCEMTLMIRPDGSVGRATQISGQRQMETYCRESMYRWRFTMRDGQGKPLTEPITGLRVVLAFDRVYGGTDGDPQSSSVRVVREFDPEIIEAYRSGEI